MAGRPTDNRERARVAQEAAVRIKRAAGERRAGETEKARIARTAQLLGWTFSRAHEVWYKLARRIEAHEMDQLRRLTGDIPRLSTDKPLENSNFD